MNALRRTNGLPLHMIVSTLFIVLVLVLGALLSLQSYRRSSDMILAGADRLYEQLSKEVQLDFAATYRPVVATLQLLALSRVVDAGSFQERLAALPLLVAGLKEGKAVSATQVGFGNGDYFVVRPLATTTMRQTFSAPPQALYVVDNIGRIESGERRLVRVFVDGDLEVVRENRPEITDYDPRQRPWYRQATSRPHAIEPYLFYFVGKVGTTVTLETPRPGVVVATDVSLEQLSATIGRHRVTPGSEVVLFDADGRVLAYPDSSRVIARGVPGAFRIARLEEMDSTVLRYFSEHIDRQPRRFDFQYRGERWVGSIDKIARAGGLDLNVLLISPVSELLTDALAIRRSSLLTTALIIMFAIPVVWLVAGRVAGPMRRLAAEADAIRRFDFEAPLTTRSFFREVNSLADAMRLMKETINRFVTLISSLAGEREFDRLLDRITQETMRVGQADAAVIYLVSDDDRYLRPGTLHVRGGNVPSTDTLPAIALDEDHPVARSLAQGQPDVVKLSTDGSAAASPLLALVASERATLVSVPLRNRQREAVGVLCLLYPEREPGAPNTEERSAQIAFVRALSGFAAVSIEGSHLLKMQQALLDAFIRLIAGAIDAKSPYTGGHCQRVPELTRMLAEAACASDHPPFAEYHLNQDDWDALHIASWLHDCGKVTTPEYVVDKATKLETLYDRIHEIRMRFEVLKRDAEIRFWEQVANGGDRDSLQAELDAALARLDDDFAFVAECNQGGEFMAPERLQRLRRIAGTTWMRTLDDRIGISWEELQRKQRTPQMPLPVAEKLIDNKQEHLIERGDAERMPDDNPWGFRLDVPEYKYNRGELYNLEVARGTLSDEERYKINDHIVQTIIMLGNLPYPKHLRAVPEFAGCHHETMDGRGYPRRLIREEMSLTARIMAIADIFEALTASDRPYKKAKTLSESLRILSFLSQDAHIDPDLFRLFLESGVWRTYAERYLKPEQIDDVDINEYLRD
ncbi:MAG: HD domain-containing phosphohydrolase [Gammaproteobacteria bacterium]